MTSSVAASFDDQKTGKQRAAVFPFPDDDEDLALGKRFATSLLVPNFTVKEQGLHFRDIWLVLHKQILRWIDFCSSGDNSKIPDNLDGICSMHFLRSSMTNLYDK